MHALTLCHPIFQKLVCTLYVCTMNCEVKPKVIAYHNMSILLWQTMHVHCTSLVSIMAFQCYPCPTLSCTIQCEICHYNDISSLLCAPCTGTCWRHCRSVIMMSRGLVTVCAHMVEWYAGLKVYSNYCSLYPRLV